MQFKINRKINQNNNFFQHPSAFTARVLLKMIKVHAGFSTAVCFPSAEKAISSKPHTSEKRETEK